MEEYSAPTPEMVPIINTLDIRTLPSISRIESGFLANTLRSAHHVTNGALAPIPSRQPQDTQQTLTRVRPATSQAESYVYAAMAPNTSVAFPWSKALRGLPGVLFHISFRHPAYHHGLGRGCKGSGTRRRKERAGCRDPADARG